MQRKRMSKKGSRKLFKRTATRTKAANMPTSPQRGGWRF